MVGGVGIRWGVRECWEVVGSVGTMLEGRGSGGRT